MNVLQAGGGVAILRFLPDGRRLLAGVTHDPAPDQPLTSARVDQFTVRFLVLPLAGGEPVALDLPPLPLTAWWYAAENGNAVAVHPDGDRCWVAWGDELYACRTTDGKRLQGVAGVPAHHVVGSPDGRRVLAANRPHTGRRWMTTISVAHRESMLGQQPLPDTFRHLAGFLPDGERFAVIDGARVCVRSADGREEVASAKYPSRLAYYPTISPDGRHLGIAGYSSFYLYDLPGLGKPRTLGTGRASADVRGFAFHPAGRTLAIILGAPTLVKLYDLETLKPTGKLDWKLGPLRSVAYSPDGTLGAAGSEDGRVVVWDADP
ncbi:MAG: WD40 repeat domain-containing protein [Gemmataceae bacterium]|nr:WD40 repeat domain-containing protein [Gemmataceae bacterium]